MKKQSLGGRAHLRGIWRRSVKKSALQRCSGKVWRRHENRKIAYPRILAWRTDSTYIVFQLGICIAWYEGFATSWNLLHFCWNLKWNPEISRKSLVNLEIFAGTPWTLKSWNLCWKIPKSLLESRNVIVGVYVFAAYHWRNRPRPVHALFFAPTSYWR